MVVRYIVLLYEMCVYNNTLSSRLFFCCCVFVFFFYFLLLFFLYYLMRVFPSIAFALFNVACLALAVAGAAVALPSKRFS